MNDGETIPRNEKEMEAEGVAYIILSVMGAGEEILSAMRGYIQGWAKGNEFNEKNARRIFAAADKILKAGAL